MIPIKDMQFIVTTIQGDKVVRGKLSFNTEQMISKYALQSTKLDLIELAKRRSRAQVWNQVYGDLIELIHDLCRTALIMAKPQDESSVRELVNKVRDLLDLRDA